MLVLALAGAPGCREFALAPSGRWALARPSLSLPPAAATSGASALTLSPANARCAADLPPYRSLVQAAMFEEKCTLRYSGALVADVHRILSAGGPAAFLCPGSPGAPPKLRLLFELAPLAFVVAAAGGGADDGRGEEGEEGPPEGGAAAAGPAGAAAGPSAQPPPLRSLLLQRCVHPTQRSAACLGSAAAVARCAAVMLAGHGALTAAGWPPVAPG